MNNPHNISSIPDGFRIAHTGDSGYTIVHREGYNAESIASAVSRGAGCENIPSGRGSAYFTAIEGIGDCVVRKYMRGGMLRFANRDGFINHDRFLNELKVNLHAQSQNVPSPEPVAVVIKGSDRLNGWMLTKKIENAIDLLSFCRITENKALVEKAGLETGAALRKMHDTGIRHGDINGANILIAEDKVYIIDYDGSSIVQSMPKEFREQNMLRLMRSLIKESLKKNPGLYKTREHIIKGYLGERYLSEWDFSYLLKEEFFFRRVWWRVKRETSAFNVRSGQA